MVDDHDHDKQTAENIEPQITASRGDVRRNGDGRIPPCFERRGFRPSGPWQQERIRLIIAGASSPLNQGVGGWEDAHALTIANVAFRRNL